MKVSELIERLRECDPDAKACLELAEGNDLWNEAIESVELQGSGVTSRAVLLTALPLVSAHQQSDRLGRKRASENLKSRRNELAARSKNRNHK